jgi:hypothetical protein
MKTQVGMWIDHREANIVFLSQDGEETKANQIECRKASTLGRFPI